MANVKFKHTGATIDQQIDRMLDGSVVVDNTLSVLDETSDKPVSGKGIAAAIEAASNKLKQRGYIYMGVATPTTTPDVSAGKVFYLAAKAGEYTNFGYTLQTNALTSLEWDGERWSAVRIADLVTPAEVAQIILDNTASEVTEDGAKPVSGAAVSEYIAGITHDAEAEQSIRILLIGSSLGMNTIGQFPMIAQYSGVKCIVGNVYQGSLTLQQIAEYCENGNQINGRYSKWNLDSNKWVHSPSNMSSVLTDEKWDYIILQNSNAEAEEWTDTQEVALKTIVDYITSLDGQPTIVFNTNCANSLGAGNAATREAQVATTERINKVCELVRNRWGFDILPLASVIQHCRGNDTLTALGKWKNGDLAQDSVHLDYGVGMYAAACMCYNFFLKRFGKSVLTNDYLPTIDQLQNFAGPGVTDLADRFTPITEEIGALIRKEVSAAMASTSSKQEVNKVYEAAGAVYNSETEMWEMNGITDLTDRDMANIVTFGNFCGLTTIAGQFANMKCRTNIRHVNSYSTLSIGSYGFRSSKFEVIDVRSTYDTYMTKLTGTAANVFNDCQKLKSVLGKLNVSEITNFLNTFNLCKALTDIQLHGLKCNVEFPASPLSVASGIYMIENASTTENITIKVMASVYSAWMADSTIAQLLTNKTNIALASF